MAKSRPGVINLKSRAEFVTQDGVSTSIITPGDVLALGTGANEVKRHDVAGATGLKYIALTNTDHGKGIDDDYPVGVGVKYIAGISGDEFYGLVPAGAAAITRGAQLELDGTGKVKILAAGEPYAVALEAVDNSGGAEPARIRYALL